MLLCLGVSPEESRGFPGGKSEFPRRKVRVCSEGLHIRALKNQVSHDTRFQKTNYLKTNLLKQIKKISFPFTAAKLLCFIFSTKNFFLKIVMLRYKIPKKRDGFQLPPLYLLCSLSKITSCRPYLGHRPLA